jgi:tetratricopeptide (TPR) repeat protein
MQQQRYAEAAAAYRKVADRTDAAADLRAQSLFASGLMLQNAREYESAAATYREVVSRFPGTLFARRAEQVVKSLEEGGHARGLEFRRRRDEASDQLAPAQALAEREGLAAARPGLERAVALLQGVVDDFPEHPQAPNVAVTLGNTQMTLGEFAAARAAYERAITLAGSRAAAGGAGPVDSIVLDAEERLVEAIKEIRRERVSRGAQSSLAVIAVALLALRPWRGADAPILRVAGRLFIATLALAVLAVGAAWVVRSIDPSSPIDSSLAALLVALPGLTGEIVALGMVGGLRGMLRPPTAVRVAATVGAFAALAAATCVVHAYDLFPVLDSML